MSMKMMNAAYLVDNAALLSLQEKQDGVEFHCFDMDSKVQTTEGHIGWDVLDKQPSSTLEESARVVALQKIPQLDGLAVAPVAPEMLEQVRGGRKVLSIFTRKSFESLSLRSYALSRTPSFCCWIGMTITCVGAIFGGSTSPESSP